MKYFLPLLAILFSLLPIGAATLKIEANPINVAAILTELPDSTALASTCEYYGYIQQSPQDGYTVYKHPNGSVIRYSFNETDDGKSYSTVEVTSKVSQKEKDSILLALNFQKAGNVYERRSVGYTTCCTNGHRGALIFQQQPNPKAL